MKLNGPDKYRTLRVAEWPGGIVIKERERHFDSGKAKWYEEAIWLGDDEAEKLMRFLTKRFNAQKPEPEAPEDAYRDGPEMEP